MNSFQQAIIATWGNTIVDTQWICGKLFFEPGLRRIVFALLTAAFVLTGCQAPVGGEEPLDPGRELLSDVNIDQDHTSLAWSPDNAKVYFTGPAGLKVVTVSTKAVQTISAEGIAMTSLTVSGNGSKLYYLAIPSGGGVVGLRSVPVAGGMTQFIADTTIAYAVSPNGQTIAITNGFTLTLSIIDVGTGDRTVIGQGRPVSFFADNQQLLYYTSSAAIVRTIAGGAETTILTLADSIKSFRTLRWSTGGVFAIVRDSILSTGEGSYERVRYGRVNNGSLTVLYTVFGYVLSPVKAYLSGDGQYFAYWSSDCISAETIPNGNCITSQYSISTYAPGSTAEKSYVLHKTGVLQRGDAVFSPDKSMMAYVAEEKLYLVSL